MIRADDDRGEAELKEYALARDVTPNTVCKRRFCFFSLPRRLLIRGTNPLDVAPGGEMHRSSTPSDERSRVPLDVKTRV